VSPRAGASAALAAVLVVVAAAALIAAIASAMDRRGARPGSTAAAGADAVTLTIVFSRRPGAARVAHLRCRGSRASADGFLRATGAARACAHARAVARLLTTPPDPNRACTEIFGGPERAVVIGRIGDRRVHRRFERTDGCEVADWQRAMPLLPRPG
jgi:hypothetical protein